MYFREKFSERLTKLRLVHQIPTAILADILELKSRTSINDFESQRTNPSVDVLLKISKLFGVSLDWLSGYSNTPYINELLISYEEEFIDTNDLHHPNITKHPDIDHLFRAIAFDTTGKYLFPEDRIKFFSLPSRANILFSLIVIRHFSKIFYSEGHSAQHERLEDSISRLLTGNKTSRLAGELCLSCYETLAALLDTSCWTFNPPVTTIKYNINN
ncbi:helix-turn-helix domain-containing protein [Pectinatus frisingensis]|uniref:helix-turn-helix domain-containing protein n=1 Tax=Pectinatus frisingensis TaxID=865 RepID=UPI0018C80057|nr:helix-turn-helix transcriptional regulator [Pectinatus frisingensis]